MDISRTPFLINNGSSSLPHILVSSLKLGVPYGISISGVTTDGYRGPSSEILRFTLPQETISGSNYPDASIPEMPVSPTSRRNNIVMIIAIVGAAVLVSVCVLFALVWIYRRRRNLSKCPHYFSKGMYCFISLW